VKQEAIFRPVIVLALLTIAVLVRLFLGRVAAVRGGVPAGFFRNYQGPDPSPEAMIVTARHFSNLFEMPVLFYAVCLALYATRTVDGTFVALAWAFVVGRLIHSAIHLTYNDVTHRLAIYLLSSALLLAMWIRFFFVLP
jgi:hypothetical protein